MLFWEGTAPWLWQDRPSRRFLDDIAELGFRAAAWWWEANDLQHLRAAGPYRAAVGPVR